MKRAFAIVAVAVLVIMAILLHTPAKEWLWTHPWWHSFLVDAPTVVLAVIAFIELRHSEKANAFRAEANTQRERANGLAEEANGLLRQIAILNEQLDAERNRQIGRIADHVKPQLTQADKIAAKLRKYIGARAFVSESQGNWGPMGAEIVEVNEDNVLTLFMACGISSSTAWAVHAHCNEVEVVEIAAGSCPVQIKVLKRYGETVQLGEIRKWEDRIKPVSTQPTLEKGSMAYYATYGKAGSAEVREMHIYAARDGSNMFVLEATPDGTFYGNNVEIAKRFMGLQVEYEAAGFTHRGSGTGTSKYKLFVKTLA